MTKNALTYIQSLPEQIDTGRSMIEMLGVLALVGILSIAAITGFRYALDKKQANDIVQAINLRAQVAHSQLIKNDDINLDEFPTTLNESTITGAFVDPNISFTVTSVNKSVCDKIINNVPYKWQISVNDQPDDSCQETNTLKFIIDTENTSGETPTPPEETDPPVPCDGTCGECQTCNVTTDTCENLPNATPCDGGEKGCKAGVCTDITICSNGSTSGSGSDTGKCCIIDQYGSKKCCTSTQIPYCSFFSDGECLYASCGTNCTFTDFGDVGACCTNGQTPYCNLYYNGTCNSANCCAGTVSKVDGLNVCCDKGQNPYCMFYNYDGTCNSGGCCAGTVSKVDGLDACCTNGQTPYCGVYNNGTCGHASCCPGPVGDFGKGIAQQCCDPGETPYCWQTDSTGICQNAGCCPSGMKYYCQSENPNGTCARGSCKY